MAPTRPLAFNSPHPPRSPGLVFISNISTQGTSSGRVTFGFGSVWQTNSTGNLDGTGAFSAAIPVSTAESGRFFRVRVP